MNTKLLEDIGLTEGETKVYLALLKLGTTKTGPLAKEANVSSSKVYKILDRLSNKGLTGNVIKGKIKYFSAMEPRRIIDYMEEKEKAFQEKKDLVKKLLPQLDMERKLSEDNTEATIYDGFKAVTNLFRSIIDELHSGDAYHVLGARYADVEGIRSFFENHHKRRADKKIKLYMLANSDIRNTIVKTTKLHSEIRFLPEYLISNMQVVFYKSTAFIVIWTKHPVAFLIKNKETVKGFQKYFDTFWKIAKK